MFCTKLYILSTVMLAIFSICLAKESNNDETIPEEMCDPTKEDCGQDESSPNLEDIQWTPFQYKSENKSVSLDKVISEYIKWHTKTLWNSKIPCEDKLAVTFTPFTGLGDSLGALKTAFIYAVKTGRLFFFDWKPYDWTVGFQPLPFNYEYSKAQYLKDTRNGRRLLCVDLRRDPASFIEGHVNTNHLIVHEKVVNDYVYDWNGLDHILFHPSAKVQALMKNISEFQSLPTKNNTKKSPVRLVALVMRTGEMDFNQFLSKGDEINFVKCFKNYAKQVANESKSEVKYRVLVTSDSEEVKRNAIAELRKDPTFAVDIVRLNNSVFSIDNITEENKNKKSVVNRIVKTHAEFFLISESDVLFLTKGSLFGHAAADRSRADERNIHYLSDSNCDRKRDKYSYVMCGNPKYPSVCGFS